MTVEKPDQCYNYIGITETWVISYHHCRDEENNDE